MSLELFNDDYANVKEVTNRTGDGVGRDNGPQNLGSGNPAPYYEVTVKEKPAAGAETTITHTGPGAGVMGGTGNATDVQGFVSATGNRVVIDNTFGADTITIQHHSGATIIIDADGSIHMISSGKKGVGIVAPKGDQTLFAKGHMILKGDGKITIETEGDLDINVGGNLGLHVGGDMISTIKGSVDESIEGSKSFEIVKDMSTMIAGDYRVTSAGKFKLQSSKSIDIDSADDFTVRTDSGIGMYAQKTATVSSVDAMSLNTKDKFTVLSAAAMDLETNDKFTTKSAGDTKISASGAAAVHAASTADFLAGALIQIKGSETDIQTGGSTSPDAPSNPPEVQLAQYAPANTIIDNVSSQRVAPDFPKNAAKMSAGEFSLYTNEGGVPNPKAAAYASANKGGGAAAQSQDTGITAEAVSLGIYDRPAGVTANGTAQQNPTPMPSSIYNSNEPISRHLKVGNILGVREVPQSRQKEVLTAAMNVAWNLLDPLIEKFGSRIVISSWYRDAPRQNHVTGGAVDVHCSNRDDYGTTAEIAAFARDNLPYSRIFLEKNDQGSIHVHLQSAQPGQPGGGEVFTCADPGCHSKVNGLKLSYAVAALEGRANG